MGKKIVINPITRISGFLEIEVKVEGNRIVDAKSSGMLFRGFEKMLQGRSPLDAVYFTERICGICSTAHSMASSIGLEETIGVVPGENDRYIRQLIHGCEFIQNHLRHTYQYTLPDYIKGPRIEPLYSVEHQDYRLPDRLNQRLTESYLQSIEYSRLGHEMLALFGGKAPHNHGIFVGGVTVNLDAAKVIKFKSLLSSIKEFVVGRMVEDICIIGEYYPEYYQNGAGYKNLMSYGSFQNIQGKNLYSSPEVYINGQLSTFDPNYISENIYHAWYQSEQVSLEPGEPPVEANRQREEGYSWVKAPRYNGYPMEVGPLARMILSGEYNGGISTMDRTIARVLEVKKVIKIMERLLEIVKPIPASQSQYSIPAQGKGVGLVDTTRGGLGHWIKIENERIKYYDIITPTAWNLSPTDSKGVKGVIEEALIGTEIQNINAPVEIGRIVRSFDPCVSCATHIISDKAGSLKVRVL